MSAFTLIPIFILIAVSQEILAQDCWWTGCQPNSWAVTGCAQYDRNEKGRQACIGGHKYHCCTGEDGERQTETPPGDSTGGGESCANFDQFRNAVTSNGYPAPTQEQFYNFNEYARSVGHITSLEESAMALAQLLHESDGLQAKREYACAQTNCPNNYRTADCDAPGQYYYGRGYIQLTWCENYKAASQAIFGNNRLVSDPDEVARDDAIAWRTSFWYWGKMVHGQPGVSSGHFGATTKAINGRLECSQPGNPRAEKRFKIYGNVRRAFGLPGAGNASGCG